MNEILDQIQGISFKIVGPFLVADLSDSSRVKTLLIGEHGMETIGGSRLQTEPHVHQFNSFYKSSGLDVLDENGERHILPDESLTLVLSGVQHSWMPKWQIGAVGSLDPRHEKQVIRASD